jgi:hypothetical protein
LNGAPCASEYQDAISTNENCNVDIQKAGSSIATATLNHLPLDFGTVEAKELAFVTLTSGLVDLLRK